MSDHSSNTSRPASPVNSLPDITSPQARPYRFNWDTTSYRNGPASVSGTSNYEGNADYITSRYQQNIFSMSTVSLAPGALLKEWSSSVNGFHAISNVLNNPKRPSDPPKAHQPVPPIPSFNLPPVKKKDFEPYMKAINPEWKRFGKNVEMGLAGSARIENGLLNPFLAEKPRPNTGSSLPSLDNIPSVFFEHDFNLELPSTFTAVIEDQKDVEFDPPNDSDSSQLLERFSHYADTIELHLIHEISLRSSSFFAALTNLRDLQSESEHCLSRISELRTSLQEIDDNSAKRGLQIVHLDAKVGDLGIVGEGCKVINGVKEALHVANELVIASQWGEALDVIEGIQKLWDSPTDMSPESFSTTRSSTSSKPKSFPNIPESSEQERRKPRLSFGYNFPISLLQSFTALPEHLRTLTLDIASSVSSELVYLLEGDLTSCLALSEESTNAKIKADVVERIQFLLQDLKRTKSFSNFIGNWRSTAISVIENSVGRYLPLSSGLDGDSAQPIADDDLRSRLSAMIYVDFMPLFRSSLAVLRNGIGRLQNQNVAIVELLESMQPLDSLIDIPSFQADLADILFSVTELAHARLSRIIDIRSEQHIGLSLSEFLEVYTETWDFVIQTETICRRMVVGLRGAIVSQAKAFLQASHVRRIALLAKVVEDEQWSAVDVGLEAQAAVNILVDSAMRDPPQLVLINEVSENTLERSADAVTNGNKTAKHLIIEDRSYFSVSATLQILSLLTEYLKFVINLSVLTTDVVGRVIEFLKAFNSRTCQVVLGAGAMRSAGLKNITAKHLALASQSLAIIIALVPYVRETFRRHLNPKQAVMLTDFDKLKRDFLEHQNEIHAKLIAIMSDRLSAHCKTLQAVDWKVTRTEVNEYMQLLVKETVTLHKVLSRYLPEQIIEYVMSQVFAAINHRLSEEFEKIELQTQESKDRLFRDAQYLHQKLSALKGLNTPTNMLETIISDKRIATSPKPVAQTTPLTANERLKGIFDRPRKIQISGKDIPRKSSSPAILAGPEKVAEKGHSLLSSPPAYEKEKDLPVIEHQNSMSQITDRFVALHDMDIGTKDSVDVSPKKYNSQRVSNVLTSSPPETTLSLPSTEIKADHVGDLS